MILEMLFSIYVLKEIVLKVRKKKNSGKCVHSQFQVGNCFEE